MPWFRSDLKGGPEVKGDDMDQMEYDPDEGKDDDSDDPSGCLCGHPIREWNGIHKDWFCASCGGTLEADKAEVL